ncbi:DUF4177 domain-containing protein [Bacillus cereus]|uniref:DUF4177 domain-containing protein n=1 Tax=unclassified Bacillus (in: firmicutes) TaxID=185979 RepID=UPI000898C9EF|nr:MULTISPECIES: DUF4177 domain-containing protein [unclassified Bacillus (in: firmicutes)]PFE01333.1 DUF4177 domain-containing protein [Bacillus sp. AFS023182]PGX96825.1 DUF4177 domain-containing protein [Bacillus cereus]SDY97677.1 protein of unknown function [Bacillus sp. 166amftsu]
MYDYKFVKIEVDKWKGQPKEDYKRIIAEHSEDGWKLVQIFTPAIAGYANYFEIIFERIK